MKDKSKKHSHYEAMTNQVVGIAIGWSLVYFAFPIMGVVTTPAQATISSGMLMFLLVIWTRI